MAWIVVCMSISQLSKSLPQDENLFLWCHATGLPHRSCQVERNDRISQVLSSKHCTDAYDYHRKTAQRGIRSNHHQPKTCDSSLA